MKVTLTSILSNRGLPMLKQIQELTADEKKLDVRYASKGIRKVLLLEKWALFTGKMKKTLPRIFLGGARFKIHEKSQKNCPRDFSLGARVPKSMYKVKKNDLMEFLRSLSEACGFEESAKSVV